MMFAALVLAAAAAGTHPCAEDAKKLCAGIEPGEGRIAACLQQHEAEVSLECKARRKTFREERKEARKAAPGAATPATPKPGAPAAGARRKAGANPGQAAIRQACNEDIQKFCADVKPGGRRLYKCLKANENKLASACIDDLMMLHE